MSNSKLAIKQILNPNHSGKRTEPITKIAIHHMAGVLDVETCARVLADKQASANYLLGADGTICLNVDESNRSWCTSSEWCDQRAVTIEVSNSKAGGDWPVSDDVLQTVIDLCVDICKRNGIKECTYTGDKSGTLQMHKWYMATACPGPYLASKFSYIASEVNKQLAAQNKSQTSTGNLYKVQVGAFSKESNAKDMEKKLQAKGYQTYIVQEKGLYKVQVGAFSELKNAQVLADKLVKDGFQTYIPGISKAKSETLKIGDIIRIKQGAKDLNIETYFADFVYDTKYQILEMGEDWVSFGPAPFKYTGKVAKSNVVKA